MATNFNDVRNSLAKHDQLHLLDNFDRLTDHDKAHLLSQLESVDFDELASLFRQRDQPAALPPIDKIEAVSVDTEPTNDPKFRLVGEEILRSGKTAVLLVAGGQGTRLGSNLPKGLYSIGPVSGKSLFQIHAEKVVALRRRYGAPVPFLVMTSNATHDETLAFFEDHAYFGLPFEDLRFFKQGEMPAFDLDTGKLLMQAPGKLFTSPNGHGGTLTALADCGALDDLGNRGVEQVFYFQVDNPLVRIAEPDFLGRHADARADVSCKVIAKKGPAEKMGCFVRIDGRCSMIEYSDVPTALAEEMDATGRLRLWAGNPAIHIFSVDFLDRLTRGHRHLPYHLARKTVTLSGPDAKPRSVNALKFEMFIFDAFPLAERIVLVETRREDEFSPLKNAEGPDSPPVVKQDISNLAARWLEQAGVEAPRNPGGEVAVPLEISPLFALDAAELATKVNASLRIDGPLYLS